MYVFNIKWDIENKYCYFLKLLKFCVLEWGFFDDLIVFSKDDKIWVICDLYRGVCYCGG